MKPKIAVIMGSKSDLKKLEDSIKLLKELKVPYRLDIISAHRHPEKLRDYCGQIKKQGVEVVIACAGMAAALPGFIASYVDIPVLGVAMRGGMMDGLDALFSMVSIPKGIGLASTGVGNSAFINALILSLEIIVLKDKTSRSKLQKLKKKFK